MQYMLQGVESLKIQPRVIIHGGAGNIRREDYPPEKYQAYREALIDIVTRTNVYMTAPVKHAEKPPSNIHNRLPSALETATFAVHLLEDNALFNSGHGSVFTRDGINELEASVMVSRGHKKRGVGVMGLRHVKNPILLARRILEEGEQDLEPLLHGHASRDLDVPSAQGHAQIHGKSAETLAEQYGLDIVEPSYFFTQRRWDEHVRALEREKRGHGQATWTAEEYLPQGTCGAVALDDRGVICAATSTGGLTNKLTGRVGDTPTLGAGFWAEEWTEDGDPTKATAWERLSHIINMPGPLINLSDTLKGFLADCLPTPSMYTPVNNRTTTRSFGGSGTGNGDSFLRTSALRTVAAIARWKPESGSSAVSQVAGPGGDLTKSAGDRWGKTGEGEGGIIGIECVVVREGERVLDVRSEILMDYNCSGMFRAWINDDGRPVMSVWSSRPSDKP